MTRIPLVFGAAAFGVSGAIVARIHTIPDAQETADVFLKYGHTDFDTSGIYGDGTSEEFIAKLDLKNGRVDTKCFPTAPGAHNPENLRAAVHKSAKALSPHTINIFYLHAPDRSVPFEDTLREINELYKQGLFKEFGISNFNSWEVAEIVCTAKANGWIAPTVYQGLYNAVERGVETELIPCLRKFGIRFYAYSPLAGGLLAGRALSLEDMDTLTGTRWDTKVSPRAEFFRGRYALLLPVFRQLKINLEKHNIGLSEAGLRWIQHHGILTPADKIIIGASSASQLETNLKDSEGGPLPDDIVQVFEDAWKKSKVDAVHYAF